MNLQYELSGAGEPVVLIHGGVVAELFVPVARQLEQSHRVLRYHRSGYAGSQRLPGALSIPQHAAQLRDLLQALGIARVHVVGHSFGANIAFQLAIDAPEAVHTLALIEPALPVPSTGPDRLAPAIELYQAGDRRAAIDRFLTIVAGPDYRRALDQALPHAFDQALADADTFFQQELPALRDWTVTSEQTGSIHQPVLRVIGEDSPRVSPIWLQRHDLVLTLLPHAETATISRATHLMLVQNERATARALQEFIGRHAMAYSVA